MDGLSQHYKEIYYDLKSHGMGAGTYLQKELENPNCKDRKEFWERFNKPLPWYESLYYTALSPYWRAKDLYFEIKMKLQRLFRGYSDTDMWNPTDSIHTYGYKIFDAHVKSKRYGYQFFTDEALETGIIDYDSQPVNFDEDDWEEREKYWVDRYEQVIKEIRWAFWFSTYDNKEYADEWAWIRYHNGIKWFATVGLSIWD